MNKEQAQKCYKEYQERGTICAGCKYQYACGLFKPPKRTKYVNVLTGEKFFATENEMEARFS